jgi:hypothetical protein
MKDQFESPKHPHQTTFEAYNKLCFQTAHSYENEKKLEEAKPKKATPHFNH